MPSVTRSSSQRARTRRGAAETAVLDATEALLAEGHPFTTLGVGQIADRAGVSRSSFYVHFPDKTALLLRLTESATGSLFSVAQAWVEDPEHTLDGLEAALAEVLAENRRHAPALGALAEVAAYEPEVAAFWRARLQQFIDVLRRRLERDRRAGRISRDIDAATAASWIAWGTERTLSQHIAAHPDSRGDARLAAGVARGIWAVMKQPA